MKWIYSAFATACIAVAAMIGECHGFAHPPASSPSVDVKVDKEHPHAGAKPNKISAEHPLRVLIAGGGVGGLVLANSLAKIDTMDVVVLERTESFKRFGGPMQLASNALQVLKVTDGDAFERIKDKFTLTGDKINGIKDGIRTEWYAQFDLRDPAEKRGLPVTGVIDRPDLQEIYLEALPDGIICNGDAVVGYERDPCGSGVAVLMESGEVIEGDVLIGADGIWSAVRACMRNEPAKGDGSGVTYSGYTVFAGELSYKSFDNGKAGYKVYIGPNRYFVVTDIGKGCYQWYAFLARPADSADNTPMPDGKSKYIQDQFVGWSQEIHHILKATQNDEIEQRDLYDRPPSVFRPWADGNVALIGDAIHAMAPNLGQGGCQAIEDAYVLWQEFSRIKRRDEIQPSLSRYHRRRLVRSATVQGLSRFASDIIIQGFDTPAKIAKCDDGSIEFQNFNYAGIVTKLLQPVLPIFFWLQFSYLY